MASTWMPRASDLELEPSKPRIGRKILDIQQEACAGSLLGQLRREPVWIHAAAMESGA